MCSCLHLEIYICVPASKHEHVSIRSQTLSWVIYVCREEFGVKSENSLSMWIPSGFFLLRLFGCWFRRRSSSHNKSSKKPQSKGKWSVLISITIHCLTFHQCDIYLCHVFYDSMRLSHRKMAFQIERKRRFHRCCCCCCCCCFDWNESCAHCHLNKIKQKQQQNKASKQGNNS